MPVRKKAKPKVKKDVPGPDNERLQDSAIKASLANSMQEAIKMIFGDEDAELCLGRMHAAIKLAKDMRLNPKEIIAKISLEDMITSKKKYEVSEDKEDWNDDDG